MNTERIKTAKRLLQQRKLNESLAIFEEILNATPDNDEVQHICGIIHAQLGNLDQALSYINQAIKLQPDVAAYYSSQGNVFSRMNKIKNAMNAYQKAIQFDPKYAPAHNNLGNCLYHQKKLMKAKKAFETAINLNPNYVDAHYNLGILFANLGENQAAIKELEKTLQLNPNHAAAYGQLAEVYLHTDNYQKAIDNYQNRLQLQPNQADAWFGLGTAFLHAKHYEKAIKAFEEVLIIDSTYPECNHNLATAYVHAGDTEKALNYYFRQLEFEPLLESYFNIGVLLMNKERNKEAITYLEHAAKMQPNYLPIHLNLGAIYLKTGQLSKAIAHYEQALIIEPENQEVAHILAAIKQEQTPEAAPTEYVQNLFDQYATYYDQHLTSYLHYQAPAKIFAAIEQAIDLDEKQRDILDLGCGTGLSGERFYRFAKHLIGIDISEEMIAQAKEKNIYDELIVADIQDALANYHDIDIIISADVFTYIGDLQELFAKAYQALKPGGLFAFTVEKTETDPYILQKNVRYAHSEKYLKKLIQTHQFKQIRFENFVLRQQHKKPVSGYLILLKR